MVDVSDENVDETHSQHDRIARVVDLQLLDGDELRTCLKFKIFITHAHRSQLHAIGVEAARDRKLPRKCDIISGMPRSNYKEFPNKILFSFRRRVIMFVLQSNSHRILLDLHDANDVFCYSTLFTHLRDLRGPVDTFSNSQTLLVHDTRGICKSH